ncbi:LacI family DNA-binding transcriptional regulator [Marinomonas polaris]|uniref:LacI family DNA-binding transcriptional regulator n=1 Tax=Marinomonas polaris TaxID=293552 RepID=UPI003F96D08F|tara:strand:+ start:1966 stop:3000 length:1035 start_codon:yes stop_codon:yes gene_type:complete
MISIKDLAKHLNISIGTVSRALNDRPDVNKDTRLKVLQAANELGYVANQSGRSLRQGTTNTIGFFIESGGENGSSNDTFSMEVLDGLQSVFSKYHLDLIVLPCSTEEDAEDYLKRIVARRLVDGLILTATQRIDSKIEFLSKTNIPFVALGRSETDNKHPWIDLDFEGVAQLSIDRLAKKGHKRIAIAISQNNLNLGTIFLNSYKDSLIKNNLDFDSDLVLHASSNGEGGYVIADQLLKLKNRPTAILLVHELMAQGLYRRLSEENLLAGRDLAVIGFRNSEQAKMFSPSLTSFRLSLRDLGISLAETLLSTMPAFQRHYPNKRLGYIWPMELVEGESDRFLIN